MSGGVHGFPLPAIVTCLINIAPHRHGYHGGERYCRCDEDVTYVYGLTPCHEPTVIDEGTRLKGAPESLPERIAK